MPLNKWIENDDEVCLQYDALIKRIAYHLKAGLPEHVSAEDLIQAGTIGLIKANKNYNSLDGAVFRTYAGIRIRGEMLDELRRLDFKPKRVNRFLRELSAAVNKVEQRKGRMARHGEVATEMELSIEDYTRKLTYSSIVTLRLSNDSLDEPTEYINEITLNLNEFIIEDILENEELCMILAGAIQKLPKREKLIVNLYYFDELNLREIGSILGVTESRICQLLTLAIKSLKKGIPNEYLVSN